MASAMLVPFALLGAVLLMAAVPPTPAAASAYSRHDALPAQAAFERPMSGDIVSLALANGPSFTYGGTPAPKFLATVTIPAPYSGNYFLQASVQFDSGQSVGNDSIPRPSPNNTTFLFGFDTNGTVLPAGTRTATARFFDPATSTVYYSVPLAFTIGKATPALGCSAGPFGSLYRPGQALQIGMSLTGGNPLAPVDWQNATYTVTFVGPSTVTTAHLVPDAQDMVTVTTPTQIGYYQLTCVFSGTSLFTSATVTGNSQAIIISEEHQLGPVQLFSNPTTLTTSQPADLYVVFHAAAGLPTPTGYFGITLGSAYTKIMPLGPNGDLLVHLGPIYSLLGVTKISLDYHGDPYYEATVIDFPLTNPPIPSGGSVPATATAGSPRTPVATGTDRIGQCRPYGDTATRAARQSLAGHLSGLGGGTAPGRRGCRVLPDADTESEHGDVRRYANPTLGTVPSTRRSPSWRVVAAASSIVAGC
jgi:hypothetical protein